MSSDYKTLWEKFYKLACDPSQDSLEQLSHFLLEKDRDPYDKHIITYLACHALLLKGREGINKLVKVLENIDGAIYPNVIIKCLWMASKGKFCKPLFASICPQFSTQLTPETVNYAREAFLDFVIKSHIDPEAFYKLIQFIYFQTIETARENDEYIEFHKDIFNILTDSTIKISRDIIDKFRLLINTEANEEQYQLFFEKHPVLIDPLAMNVINKQKLGTEFVTDFVIETLRGDFILVEIEKPQDKIFTKSGAFSSKFSRAFSQVLDFIEWIENNIAYAQQKLPGIYVPKGLVIMGRSCDLTDWTRKKLHRFNRNSNSIEILTYDDILTRAESLYKNIKKKIEIRA